MTIKLVKGSSISLEKNNQSLTHLKMGANWGMITTKSMFGSKQTPVDLDALVALYDSNKVLIDVCYFGQKASKCKAVKHSGDDLTGDSSADDLDNETITVDLQKLNPNASYIGLVLFSYRKQPFGTIPYIGCSVYDNSSSKEEKLASFQVNLDTNLSNKVAMLVGACIKQASGVWEFKAAGTAIESQDLGEISRIALRSL